MGDVVLATANTTANTAANTAANTMNTTNTTNTITHGQKMSHGHLILTINLKTQMNLSKL